MQLKPSILSGTAILDCFASTVIERGSLLANFKFSRVFFTPISTVQLRKMSLCRQNYHEDCEAGINKQINLELYASYVYLSMVGSLSSLCHFSIQVV